MCSYKKHPCLLSASSLKIGNTVNPPAAATSDRQNSSSSSRGSFAGRPMLRVTSQVSDPCRGFLAPRPAAQLQAVQCRNRGPPSNVHRLQPTATLSTGCSLQRHCPQATAFSDTVHRLWPTMVQLSTACRNLQPQSSLLGYTIRSPQEGSSQSTVVCSQSTAVSLTVHSVAHSPQ